MSALMDRRGAFRLLAGASVAVSAGIPLACVEKPDAELIAACAEFSASTRARYDIISAWDDLTTDVPEEALEPFFERSMAVLDGILDTRATTMAGVLARARALVVYDPDMVVPGHYGSNGVDSDLAAAVIRDLLAVAGGAA